MGTCLKTRIFDVNIPHVGADKAATGEVAAEYGGWGRVQPRAGVAQQGMVKAHAR